MGLSAQVFPPCTIKASLCVGTESRRTGSTLQTRWGQFCSTPLGSRAGLPIRRNRVRKSLAPRAVVNPPPQLPPSPLPVAEEPKQYPSNSAKEFSIHGTSFGAATSRAPPTAAAAMSTSPGLDTTMPTPFPRPAASSRAAPSSSGQPMVAPSPTSPSQYGVPGRAPPNDTATRSPQNGAATAPASPATLKPSIGAKSENGAALGAVDVVKVKATEVDQNAPWYWKVFRRGRASSWESDLQKERAMPLPMTFPGSEPSPPEKLKDALACDPEKKICKTPIYTWTDTCTKCGGLGTVSFFRRGKGKGRETISTCITCQGIGYVQRITARADISHGELDNLV